MDKTAKENATVKEFFSQYPHKVYKKGQILIYGGDDPEDVFYITKGTVKQYDIGKNGDEVVVNVFKPFAFFPMSWAINRQHNPYFFEAETDIELYRAPADAAVSFIKTHPDVMFDLLSRLYSGTDGLQRRMAHLMGGTAETRLVFELVVQCKRFGKDLGKDGISLLTTDSSLAEKTGLTRETVSRELSKLAKQSLLTRQGRFILIPSITSLENHLGDVV